jgi:hypothetical protein
MLFVKCKMCTDWLEEYKTFYKKLFCFLFFVNRLHRPNVGGTSHRGVFAEIW